MTKYKNLALIVLFSLCCFFSTSLFVHSDKLGQPFGSKAEKNIVLLVPQSSSGTSIAVLTHKDSSISILEHYQAEYFPDIPKISVYLFKNYYQKHSFFKKNKYKCIIQSILTVFPHRVLRN